MLISSATVFSTSSLGAASSSSKSAWSMLYFMSQQNYLLSNSSALYGRQSKCAGNSKSFGPQVLKLCMNIAMHLTSGRLFVTSVWSLTIAATSFKEWPTWVSLHSLYTCNYCMNSQQSWKWGTFGSLIDASDDNNLHIVSVPSLHLPSVQLSKKEQKFLAYDDDDDESGYRSSPPAMNADRPQSIIACMQIVAMPWYVLAIASIWAGFRIGTETLKKLGYI